MKKTEKDEKTDVEVKEKKIEGLEKNIYII